MGYIWHVDRGQAPSIIAEIKRLFDTVRGKPPAKQRFGINQFPRDQI